MKDEQNVEKYVRGELSAEEKKAFENKLKNDPALAQELASFRKDELIIKSAARKKIRDDAQIAFEKSNKKSGKRVVMLRRIAVAAGFLLIIVGGLWWMNSPTNVSSPDQLYAQHFTLPPSPALRSGGDAATDQKWEQAISFYSENNLTAAIPVFRELLTDEFFTKKETAKLLLATSLMAKENYGKALEVLKGINPESSYKEDAEWYQALALFKLGKTDEAKNAFYEIASKSKHYKKEEAGEFLKNFN